MKKSLIALAAVAASGAAFAQSSVTVFGVVDQAVSYVNGGNNWNGINSGGNQTSRLGFRGVEDLGGGLKANFWLESGINADDGSGNSGFYGSSSSADKGLAFKRRSTIGLEGSFGEVRLGRELTAAYSATSRYDVFGQVGFGVSRLWADGAMGGAVKDAAGTTLFNNGSVMTNQRVSNMITYASPSFSGFKAAVNYGFGEKAGDNRDARYIGAGMNYDNGPLSLGLSAERQNRGTNTLNLDATADVTAWALGGSYDLGVVKLAAAYKDSQAKFTDGSKDKTKGYYLGLSAPVGAAGEVKASYNRYENKFDDGFKVKADQFALGYVHNLSKRTAVYGTYAYIKNKNNDGENLGISLGGAILKDNGSQHGLQVGVRHAF